MDSTPAKKRGDISGYILSSDGLRVVPVIRVELLSGLLPEEAVGMALCLKEVGAKVHWKKSDPTKLSAVCSAEKLAAVMKLYPIEDNWESFDQIF